MSEYNIQINKYDALNADYDQLYPATKIENVDGLDTALQKKVNKAGDTMTGDLLIEKTNPTIRLIDSDGSDGSDRGTLRHESNTDIFWIMRGSLDGTSYSGFKIYPETTEFGNSFKVIRYHGGVSNELRILHEGNKPSGSYTGNGSATSRTIDTGGIGNVCMVWQASGSRLCIVTPRGCIGSLDGTPTALINTAIKFEAGILTIATDSKMVNAASTGYSYQVL